MLGDIAIHCQSFARCAGGCSRNYPAYSQVQPKLVVFNSLAHLGLVDESPSIARNMVESESTNKYTVAIATSLLTLWCWLFSFHTHLLLLFAELLLQVAEIRPQHDVVFLCMV